MICSHNALTSLIGAPEIVNDEFNCRDNQITSLFGVPQRFKGTVYCQSNPLESLTHAPHGFSYLESDLGTYTKYDDIKKSLLSSTKKKDQSLSL